MADSQESGTRREKAMASLARVGSWAHFSPESSSNSSKRKSRRQSLTSGLSGSFRRRSLPAASSKLKNPATEFPAAVRSTLTLPEVIRNKVILECFYDYCKSQHCVENLMFWIVTETFSRVHNPALSQQLGVSVNKQLLEQQARNIYDQYLRNDAEHWVCLDCKDVDHIEYILLANAAKPSPGATVTNQSDNIKRRPSTLPQGTPIPGIQHNLFHSAQVRTRKDLEEDIIPRFIRALLSPRGLLSLDPLAAQAVAELLSKDTSSASNTLV